MATNDRNDDVIERLERLSAPGSALATAVADLRASGGVPPPDLVTKLQALTREIADVRVVARRQLARLEQLQVLVRTASVVNSSLDVEVVLAEVMDAAIHLTRAERAFLMLRGESGFEVRAARNWDRSALADADVTFSRSVIDAVLASGEPVVTMNAQGDARFQGNQSVLMHDLRSILCIPLKLREQLTGVLYADNRLAQGVFDRDSIGLVAVFADFAAIAIENARHFMRVAADLTAAKHEVARLRIEVDQRRVRSEVANITDTDYFQRLEALARDARARKEQGR
jgi:GAF domain-containing protein